MKILKIAIITILLAIGIFGFLKEAVDKYYDQDVVITSGEVELGQAYIIDANGNRIPVED